MGFPRPLFVLLILLCAVAIVAHQSLGPLNQYFASKVEDGRKVVTLADLGTTYKVPSSSPFGSGKSNGTGSWQDALGGLFQVAGEGGLFTGGRKDPAGVQKLSKNVNIDQTDGSRDGADVSKDEDVVSEKEDDDAVLDWGLLSNSAEESEMSGTLKPPKNEASKKGYKQAGTDSFQGGETPDKTDPPSVWKASQERPITGALGSVIHKTPQPPKGLTCKDWMLGEWEKWEEGFRDFGKQPVQIVDAGFRSWFETTQEELAGCDVVCELHASGTLEAPDATTEHWVGEVQPGTRSSGLVVLRNVESFTNYPSVAISEARAAGVDIVSDFRLDSDVPHVYFSWSGCAFNLRGKDCQGLDIMAPVHKKEATAAAAAFISNCEAKNFRTAAVKGLIANNVSVNNYGDCVHTADLPGGDVKGYDESQYGSKYHNKLVQFQKHKFSLAFENSCEDDYVTEKFFHALAAGSVPVVVGAPNTAEFAPAPNSYLQIDSEEHIPVVAEQIKYLMKNVSAYNEMLKWKAQGPSDAFKALMDLQAVHPTCRLCQHIASRVREQEERARLGSRAPTPCHCQETVNSVRRSSYMLLVRERGRAEFEPLILDALSLRGVAELEAAVLREFKSLGRDPVWMETRTAAGVDTRYWQVYRLYPAGLTQREALYGRRTWGSDVDLMNYLSRTPCPKLEVIFV